MKPIKSNERLVANIRAAEFAPFVGDSGQVEGEVFQVNGGRSGYGFHIFRMQPGQTTVAHEHIGDEEFYVIEGDLTDHDGFEYGPGDLVCLRSGTIHNSTTRAGCLLAVYLRDDAETGNTADA